MGKRTKKSLKGLKLSTLSWGPNHETAFFEIKDMLINSVKLSYPCPQKATCVFTDASDMFWSSVVTQVDPKQLSLPLEEQRHKPLGFLGSGFHVAELGWSTFEKEAFSIFQTFKKLDYILLTQEQSHVYTDHRNLHVVFAPLALEPALGRHIFSKVQLWALYLSQFPYVIEHIVGEQNVIADMLTRWCRGYRRVEAKHSKHQICASHTAGNAQKDQSDVRDWPSLERIKAEQLKSAPPRKDIAMDEDGFWRNNGAIWIADDAVVLKQKIQVASHGGVLGHRGMEATESVIREDIWWSGLKEEVSTFIHECLLCILTRSGGLIPRHLATALHGTRPNEVIHTDFLFIGEGINGQEYMLILRDDLSSYIWLWPKLLQK